MKLITFLYNSKELVGVITPDGQRAVPCSELGVNYADMETLAAHFQHGCHHTEGYREKKRKSEYL